MEKWIELYNEFKGAIDCDERYAVTEQLIEKYENEYKLNLPEEYRLYLQVFTGCCLFHKLVTISFDFDNPPQETTYILRISFSLDHPSLDELHTPNAIKLRSDIENLLKKNVLVIGDIDPGYYTILDLSTYSAIDKSCDILFTGADELLEGEIFLIGRNFYDFIRDYCCLMKPQTSFPNCFKWIFTDDDYLK